jgi:hypothetical protein
MHRTSYSPATLDNLLYGIRICGDVDNTVLVGTGACYFTPEMKEYFGEVYDRDIDLAVTKEFLKTKKNFEDYLFSEGFLKGAITEKIAPKKRRVLPDSYVFMKRKEQKVDILFGFWVSNQYFYYPLETREDIKEISERYSIGDEKINVLKPECQLAEKLMLPEKKRAISFDKILKIELSFERTPEELAEEVAAIIKASVREKRLLKKWYDEIRRLNYKFGDPSIKRKKQIFFKELKEKLKL